MLPTLESRRLRIGNCISDLSENGIQVINSDDRRLGVLVREHLDYFQMMLGYDSDPAEVLKLLKDQRHPA